MSRTYKVSRDPEFAAKVKDVVGLYLNPPEHAIVLGFYLTDPLSPDPRATDDVDCIVELHGRPAFWDLSSMDDRSWSRS